MKTRTSSIRDVILERGEIRVKDLCDMFPGVSPMTIRRDLAELEAERLIVRTHGGARTYVASSREPWYKEREGVSTAQKRLIAGYAATLLQKTRCIFLDAGTTGMNLARMLPQDRLNVITSSVNTAVELALARPLLPVIVIGGRLNPKTLSCSGSDAQRALDGLNIDTAFMSASGFSTGSGFTVGDFAECELKRAVIARAQRVIMMIDSLKTGVNMPYTFARPRDIDVMVTDSDFPHDARKMLEEQGVEVHMTRETYSQTESHG